MSQLPSVSSTAQNQPGASAPTHKPDGSNVLPSTTTDKGAEVVSGEHAPGTPPGHSPSSGEQTSGDSSTSRPQSSDDQTDATSMPDAPPDEAGEI